MQSSNNSNNTIISIMYSVSNINTSLTYSSHSNSNIASSNHIIHHNHTILSRQRQQQYANIRL
jgi:hypothetical protein